MTVIDDIDAAGDASYNISEIGSELQANKGLLQSAASNVAWEMWVLILAMGMLETQDLTSAERDTSKDYDGNAANVSFLNLSIDLVQQVGSYSGDPWDLCKPEHIPDVVNVVSTGISKWGVNPFLDFVRGGETAFHDGYSYDVYGYRNVIKTIANCIRCDHSLLTDDRRVNAYLAHV